MFEKDKLENADCSKLNKAFCKTQDNIMIKSEVVECGYCCLIHEQFALNYARVKSSVIGTDTIYIADRFESCASPVPAYPRGTILARNFSPVPVSFSVYGDQSKNDMTVQPNLIRR